MIFDWDENKAKSNLLKHQVSFDEAKTIFDDPFYIDFYDLDHSKDEERYLIVSRASTGKLLIVSYTERENAIRIISARKLTKSEQEMYEEG
ncbi:MAG: BrnT family toxin [Cyanobacteria bacterium P01_C01_bin.72]